MGSNIQSHVIEDCELLSGSGSLQEKKEEIKPPPTTPKVIFLNPIKTLFIPDGQNKALQMIFFLLYN